MVQSWPYGRMWAPFQKALAALRTRNYSGNSYNSGCHGGQVYLTLRTLCGTERRSTKKQVWMQGYFQGFVSFGKILLRPAKTSVRLHHILQPFAITYPCQIRGRCQCDARLLYQEIKHSLPSSNRRHNAQQKRVVRSLRTRDRFCDCSMVLKHCFASVLT